MAQSLATIVKIYVRLQLSLHLCPFFMRTGREVSCETAFYARLPESSLKSRTHLSATDFQQLQLFFFFFFVTGIVGDQSPISRRPIAARSAIVYYWIGDRSSTDRRLVSDWSVTDRRLVSDWMETRMSYWLGCNTSFNQNNLCKYFYQIISVQLN